MQSIAAAGTPRDAQGWPGQPKKMCLRCVSGAVQNMETTYSQKIRWKLYGNYMDHVEHDSQNPWPRHDFPETWRGHTLPFPTQGAVPMIVPKVPDVKIRPFREGLIFLDTKIYGLFIFHFLFIFHPTFAPKGAHFSS